jgi:hypothetical protein
MFKEKENQIKERIRYTIVGVIFLLCVWIVWNTEEAEIPVRRNIRGMSL